MALKKSVSKDVKIDKDGYVFVDDRKFFSVVLPDGRRAETKAKTMEDAIVRIEQSLQINLQEAA